MNQFEVGQADSRISSHGRIEETRPKNLIILLLALLQRLLERPGSSVVSRTSSVSNFFLLSLKNFRLGLRRLVKKVLKLSDNQSKLNE
jgi:hypothetical protein